MKAREIILKRCQRIRDRMEKILLRKMRSRALIQTRNLTKALMTIHRRRIIWNLPKIKALLIFKMIMSSDIYRLNIKTDIVSESRILKKTLFR